MADQWRHDAVLERFDGAIFEVRRVRFTRESRGPAVFTTVASRDWAIIVPVTMVGDRPHCVMVRQYRIGAGAFFLEFPGGIVEEGEDPALGVARELGEETGWRASRIVHAGTMSPNPAFLENSFHVYVGFGLEYQGGTDFDEHEEIECLLVPLDEVREGMGRGELANAMMASGLLLAERILAREGWSRNPLPGSATGAAG